MKKINSKIKSIWGISEAGFSLMSGMETSFFMYFLTDAALLPMPIVALVSSVTGLADIVFSVLAGAIIDKFNLKGGKYRPWLLYCSPVVIIFFILMFSKIGTDNIAALIISVGFIVSHAFWNIAWTANRTLIASLSDDPSERAFLSGRLAIGAAIGRIISSFITLRMAEYFKSIFDSPTVGYTITAAVGGVVFAICYFIHYSITKGYDIPAPVAPGQKKKSVTLLDMLKTIVTNPPLLVLVIADSFKGTGNMCVNAMIAYFIRLTLVVPDANVVATVSNVITVMSIGQLLGSTISRRIASKFGAKTSQVLGNGGLAVIMVVVWLVPASLTAAYIFIPLAIMVYNIGMGQSANMYSMCGTWSEHKTGNNIRGLIMSCSALSIKIAVAARGAIVAAALAYLSYDPQATLVGEAAEAMGSGIKTAFCLIPAAFCAMAVVVILFFRINEADIPLMEKEILERKATATS